MSANENIANVKKIEFHKNSDSIWLCNKLTRQITFFTLYDLISFETLKPRSVKTSLAFPFIEMSV